MTIRDVLTDDQLNSLYAVVLVANELEHDHSVIRGIVSVPVFPKEAKPESLFFGSINRSILEHENLPEFKVQRELSPGAAMQRAVFNWPSFVTVVSTNVKGWMEPMINDIKENTSWLDGRDIHVVDLAQFVDCQEHQVFEKPFVEEALPPCIRRGPTGSLNRLLRDLEVNTNHITDPVYAVRRARMIKEGVLKALDRELQSSSKTAMS